MILDVTNLLLHTIGVHLMRGCYKHNQQNVQQIVIKNLCIVEIVYSFLNLFTIPLSMFVTLPEMTSQIITHIQHFSAIVSFTLVDLMYYVCIVYVAADMLFTLHHGVRYMYQCNITIARFLITGSWLVSMVLCVSLLSVSQFTGFQFQQVIREYFYIPLDFVVILITMVTYVCIIHRYKRTAMTMTRYTNDCSRDVFTTFPLYLTLVVLTKFLILRVTPDFVYIIFAILKNDKAKLLSLCNLLSYAFSNFIDSLLFIFIQKPLRRLYKRIHRKQRSRNDEVIALQQTNASSLEFLQEEIRTNSMMDGKFAYCISTYHDWI